ncbi:MAG: transposase, partial [Ignavibacteria bacterium]
MEKIKKLVKPLADILCYCLMPNHFHFLLCTNDNINSEQYSNNIKVLLRSYTRAINKQENRVGSLFQQNSRVKIIIETDNDRSEIDDSYFTACFHYIHQNPLRAKLVSRLEDWEFSSFRDYVGLRSESICNWGLAKRLLGLPENIEELY